MSRKIIGNTVGTPISPQKIVEKTKVNEHIEDGTKHVTSTEKQTWNNKLDTSKLSDAVNTALAQAKASGAFDGKDGQDGVPGEKGDKGDKGDTGATGSKGADGTPCTHSWNGTTLTVTSASGTTSADLKGEKGDKGDTGSKGDKGDTGASGKDGTDATVTTANITKALGYTPAKQSDVESLSGQKADKTAIPTKTSQLTNDSGFLTQHQDISGKVDKNAITLDKHTDGLVYIFISGNPVGNGVELGEIVEGDVIGVLDDNNNIVLTGALADGTYTLKYEKEDGTFTDIGNLIVGETVVEIINQIPISTDASGNLFVGTNGEKGYKTGFRLSTSTGNETSTAGVEVTGFIPVKKNDTIYIKGITFGASNGSHAIVYYDSSKARVGGGYIGTLFGKGVNGEIASVKITTDCAFIRISADVINADSILTVNQPITE